MLQDQTNKIREEWKNHINSNWKDPQWDFESYATLVEFAKKTIQMAEDFFLSKIDELLKEQETEFEKRCNIKDVENFWYNKGVRNEKDEWIKKIKVICNKCRTERGLSVALLNLIKDK